jgi:hypothetical protein
VNGSTSSPDRVTSVALFGARFVDAATGMPVADGLDVTLFPLTRPTARVNALVSHGGVFFTHRVPGFGRLDLGNGVKTRPELAEGNKQFWQKAMATAEPFVVEVRDRLGRFLPISFRTMIPTPGPFGTGGPPSGMPASMELHSAPARFAPHSTAVVRAQLTKHPSGPGLAHALVIVECAGKAAGRSIADAAGKVAVMFSYPEPPSSPGVSTKRFTWPLKIKVHHASLAAPSQNRPSDLPDRGDLLDQASRPSMKLFVKLNPDQIVNAFDCNLKLAQELILRTEGRSELFISTI